MTVAEYFSRHRDQHGRAQLTQNCWIEHGVGCFRLNTPGGEFTLLGSDDVKVAEVAASQAFAPYEQVEDEPESAESPEVVAQTETGPEDEEALGRSDSFPLDISEDEVADKVDDFRGQGAWPGRNADDAESGDFEDSVSDILDDEDESDTGEE